MERSSGSSVFIGAFFLALGTCAMAQLNPELKGMDIVETGLTPVYPASFSCSRLTSLYASWEDVDGTRRGERHSGVDGGRLGEPIFAPASGTIVAAWKANWGWGPEGALLLRHGRSDVGLRSGPRYYYSEFDHLNLDDISRMAQGMRVERGEQLAKVFRPGGKLRYLPEVHWEVWEVEDDSVTKWGQNEFGGRRWINNTAHLIDPLYMLSLEKAPSEDGGVEIAVFDSTRDYKRFRGFTYILPCYEKEPNVKSRRR